MSNTAGQYPNRFQFTGPETFFLHFPSFRDIAGHHYHPDVPGCSAEGLFGAFKPAPFTVLMPITEYRLPRLLGPDAPLELGPRRRPVVWRHAVKHALAEKFGGIVAQDLLEIMAQIQEGARDAGLADEIIGVFGNRTVTILAV